MSRMRPPRPALSRPTLIPGLPRIWRGPGELQLGLDAAHAVVLKLPDPRAARVLDLLDGVRSERAVLVRAAEFGVPPDEVRVLLDLLHRAGLVLPGAALLPPALSPEVRARLTGEAAAMALSAAGGPDGRLTPARVLRRRQGACVVLSGRGRLGAPIAVALAEAGVGHLYPDLSGVVGAAEITGGPLGAADTGSPRRAAVTAAVLRAAPGTDVHGSHRMPAALVVQLAHDEPAALVAAGHATRRQAHLAVTVRDGAAVIGPLVPAGGSPCLRCVDLHRQDRDAGWPGTLATTGPDTEPCTVATLLAATAYATAEVLAHLDGHVPETLGASVEITTPGRFRRRTWPPHPGCDCQRWTRSSTGPSPHKPKTTRRRAE
ncbi:hypothetical protein AMIS_73300 [Actinoplanes missouriensis 431]|uniref:THIF-type NAD/FAD binding fold domain-containing protein n=1 Tax=Actinoplanes missouriensis (strain ATCC 14538 / DSM 43046 / CBS 188.64 / JCM 3121 / NBRC 102363 / NCIMB 12654 / NRRL B-3342 / UNCC 431) TaxID=512565 RepID=I0HHR3_ACTM4|nr:hypothetical protein [Actinoplanes missouriensis]BAL92550.1 hypothetical protein AMIS_73300 [Actinoplanes missouriensis 431]